jgi:hypothetical protein
MRHLFVAVILCFVGFAYAGSFAVTVAFSETDLIFSRANGYDVVDLKGYPCLLKPGAPRLPRVVLPVLVPADAEAKAITITGCDIMQIPGTYDVIPAQPDVPLPMPGKVHSPRIYPADAALYSSAELYPAPEIRIAGTGIKNGFKVVHIELYPLRYIAARHILEFSRQVTFELEYEEANLGQSVPTSRQRDMAARALSALVINPEDIAAFAPRVTGPMSIGRVPPGHYEYVIISAPPMDTVFQRLAIWKTRKGIPATVVNVSWINSNYTGYDLPEKIRNFIIDAYANWGTIYVLLGGSADHRTSGQNIVPSRRAFYVRSFVGSYTDEDTIPCDLYYSDLNGSWDLDGDHIWGELNDNVNMYADVYVGRASVYNVAAAQNFVYKAMMYEKNPPTVHLRKMLLPTAILWSSYEERPMQDSIATMTPTSWVDAKLYERNGLLSRTRMIDSMNVGYGLGHWVGHGNETGIYMGGSAYLNSTDADNLVNGDKQGIANSIACFTGAWDETAGGDCFAEHLVNRSGGGLVVAMMNSRYGWGAYVGGYVPGPSERLDTTFHANIFQDNVYHVGETHGLAKDAWVPYADSGAQYDMTRWCLYELNLFGDPELPVWSEIPDSMRVTHNAVIPIGANIFVVLVRQSNNITPVPNALVCLMGKNDAGLYGTGYTNASGTASITVNASIPNDTMFVTVTHQNLYPYQGFAIVEDAGMPDTPVIMAPLDYARLPDVQPTLSFYSSDPQGDNLQYRLLWDTDPAFASPDSSTTALFSSGAIVNYVIPSPLADGATYWWKVKCTDPSGSGLWTVYSEMRSFTIGTNLPAGTCSWFQTTSAQFSFDSYGGTMIQGDSIVLVPAGQTIVDTILEQNFEAAGIPAGWTVVDGNGDTYKWTTGTSSDIGSYTPPSYGTRYAYYSDDDAGSGVVNYNEQLISPAARIPNSAQEVEIQYGYGFRVYQTGEVYEVLARFHSGATWGSWQVIQTYTTSGSGNANISLAVYLPADSVQLAWKYHDESSSSHWGYACACDNVLLRYSYTLTNNEGTVTSVPVNYGDLTATAARPHWGTAHWHKADSGDSIGIQLEYYSGSWQIVPDVDLPGNSSGFFTTEQTGSISLSSMDTLTYETLRLVGALYRKNVKAPNEPALLDWEIGDLSSTETVPPEPFSLIAPIDSSVFQNPRPNFIWHATLDSGSGLRDYRIYVGGLLKHTGVDTSWLANYDLPEGYNSWYIVAYDSANNARHSNETWIVVIDTTAPPAVSLAAPSDNSYLNTGSVSFVWHGAIDNISGVAYYTLQYALNNAFTQGLVETTLNDTMFNATLPDTIYYWRVRATDIANNEGAFSQVWQFEIDLQSPSTPALVSPINGNWLNDTLVELQWSAVSERSSGREPVRDFRAPVRYIVQIDITPNFISPVYFDTLATSAAIVALDQGFYYWRVRAFDLAGNQGQFSAVDSFGVDIGAPSAVTLIIPNDSAYLNVSPVNLAWHSSTDNLSGVDHYVLQYALNSSFTQGLVELTLADTVVAIAFAETTYYWHVRAVDVASNQGANSPTWQFEIDTQPPNVPILVTPTGGIWYSDTLLEFEWSGVTSLIILGPRVNADRNAGSLPPPLSPVQYILEIDTNDIFSAPVIVDTCMSTAVDVSLDEGFYYWRVRAFDLASNQGMYSDHDSVGVDITAPDIESTMVWNDTTYPGPFEIVTSVTDYLSGVDSVILYYKRDEDPAWNATVMHVSSPGWYLDSIPAVAGTNDSVRYYVQAMDLAEPANITCDPSGAPNSYYCFVANATGIAELTASSGFFSFSSGQNPSRGVVLFSIALPDDGVINLFVYDVSGRLIAEPICGRLSRGKYEIALDLQANTGIYFYSLESPWGKRCGKIVLVK